MVKIVNNLGSVSISSNVFTVIAGDAATRCFGVKGMVGKAKDSGIYQLLRRESMSKGVTVTFNDDDSTVSVELHIGVDQGVNLIALGNSIINEVAYKVSQAAGVPVKEVNVFVDAMLIG